MDRRGSALNNGSVTESTITASTRRVLYDIDRFGYMDGKQKHTVTPAQVEANAAIIRKTSADAAVLLKNAGAAPLLRGSGQILVSWISDDLPAVAATRGACSSVPRGKFQHFNYVRTQRF